MADNSKTRKHAERKTESESSSSGRSSTKSQKRWASILEIATNLFREKGFYASSMQDISDAVGIKKGSLYYYVRSKEELLFEILKDLHKGGEALIEGVNLNSSDPLGELRSLLVQFGLYAAKHSTRLQIFDNDFDYVSEESKKIIISERRLYWTAVVQLITAAIEKGQISSAIEPEVAAHAALRTSTSVSDWYRPGGKLAIEQIAVQNAALIVKGLANYDRP
ncbi:TetR/AcrR family transcriptional regulator [Parasphingorhabdus sp.]|uniref:TetR/AcrR family transcriptional regulator n=1 Tax=Parasphingorhabdus sp. TaxID=2709688 RepID=UPI002F952DD6